MSSYLARIAVQLSFVASLCAGEPSPDWPQFRGPGGSGIAAGEKPAPVEFSKEKNLQWSTPVGSGHSSPCISGNKIFLTAADKSTRTLTVICLDRTSGKVLWERERTCEKLEPCHAVSNAATASPATDGHAVFAYFSSYGLTAYDFEGKELWTKPLPIAVNRMGFGSGTSPVVTDGLVLLDVHAGGESHLLALRAKDGKEAWKSPNPLFNEGWSTPVVWQEGDEKMVGVFNASRFTARRLKDGAEKWWIQRIAKPDLRDPCAGWRPNHPHGNRGTGRKQRNDPTAELR